MEGKTSQRKPSGKARAPSWGREGAEKLWKVTSHNGEGPFFIKNKNVLTLGVGDSMSRAKGGLTEKRGHLLHTHISWVCLNCFPIKEIPGGGTTQAPARVFFFLNVKTDSCKRLTSVKSCTGAVSCSGRCDHTWVPGAKTRIGPDHCLRRQQDQRGAWGLSHRMPFSEQLSECGWTPRNFPTGVAFLESPA